MISAMPTTQTFNATRPNFFLVGAPKCGTTSLYAYLADHPEIFFPTVKEPQFFGTDFKRFREWTNVDTVEKYENLYRQVPDRCRVVGDASTFYLYSKEAIQQAYEFNPDAKFMAMLRNPVDMAYSLHAHYVYRGREDVADFETAWRLQEDRRRGEQLPNPCLSVKQLMYGDVCRLGEQVERLLSIVSREQVKIMLIDDLKASAKNLYEETLDFLGIGSDGRTEFPRLNESKTHRFGFVGRVMLQAPFPLNIIRQSLSAPVRLRIGKSFHKLFSRPQPRSKMRPELRHELTGYFREDVSLLEGLIERDLSHWRQVPASTF